MELKNHKKKVQRRLELFEIKNFSHFVDKLYLFFFV